MGYFDDIPAIKPTPLSFSRDDVLADVNKLAGLKSQVGVGAPAVRGDAGGVGRDSPYDVALQETLDKYGGFEGVKLALDDPAKPQGLRGVELKTPAPVPFPESGAV